MIDLVQGQSGLARRRQEFAELFQIAKIVAKGIGRGIAFIAQVTHEAANSVRHGRGGGGGQKFGGAIEASDQPGPRDPE